MRIACGERDDLYLPGQRCRDCGAGTGDMHEDGCGVERCSERHRNEDGSIQQAISCTECWAEDDRTFWSLVGGLRA